MARFLALRAAGAAATLLLAALALHALLGRLPPPPGGTGFGPGGASLTAFLAACARLDFGHCPREGRPVLAAALGRLGFSLALAVPAFSLALAAALAAAALSARRPGGRLDRLLGHAAALLQALPPFVLAAFLLHLVSRGGILPLFPAGGAACAGMEGAPPLARALDLAHHLALPALCLAAGLAPPLARTLRASLLSALAEDHTRFARAQGLPESRVTARAMRASLAPALALAAPFIPLAAGHAVVLESLFALPGLGTFVVDAVARRALPEVACAALLVSLGTTLCLAFTDLAARLADPRHGSAS